MAAKQHKLVKDDLWSGLSLHVYKNGVLLKNLGFLTFWQWSLMGCGGNLRSSFMAGGDGGNGGENCFCRKLKQCCVLVLVPVGPGSPDILDYTVLLLIFSF